MTGNDWQVLLYTIGRAMLWLVVISSCLSMYGYFRSFYRSVLAGPTEARHVKTATKAKVATARE
jgi:hypothetical protein